MRAWLAPGWPGTNGIPSFIAASDPKLCTTVTLNLANSLGADATMALFIGIKPADWPTTQGLRGRPSARDLSGLQDVG